jgi:hypothetical protein
VPSNKPDGLVSEKDFKKLAKPYDFKDYKSLIATASIKYGILGHNGIFAHRIVDASHRGLINPTTAIWLLKRLEVNIGSQTLEKASYQVEKLLMDQKSTDWNTKPAEINLPHSQRVRDWLSENTNGYWEIMMDLKAHKFEQKIQEIKNDEWDLIRVSQYAMSSLNGSERASHVMIFTQAIWSLVNKKLISKPLAALQVHRMLRQYLKNR